ncbi:MAG: hypothetical protein K1X81_01970 [Bacteroidia bacterium]|nr:hypothetical protein [Bacteroidia bacterium]
MKRPKLNYNDMQGITEVVQLYMATCSVMPGHHNECVGHVLAQLLTRVQRQVAGFVRETYRVKLTPAERAAILYVRNDLHHLLHSDNGIVRLLRSNQ